MGTLLRFIFFFFIASMVWRFVSALFFPKPSGNTRSTGQRREGVKVTSKGKDESYIPDNEGDYIDFEEVK